MAFSIKMRASKGDKHISGAETIVMEKENIENITAGYIKRALEHELGAPDFINIKIDKINKKDIIYIDALPIKTINCKNKEDARRVAKNLLKNEGISDKLIEKSFKIIDDGGMRGAPILNLNGERLEPDKERGVRVKNISTTEELKEKILKNNIGTDRTVDAIAIASKVINLGVIAELCTSDNNSYTTGYVATKNGYFRITNLKQENENGGRVFFVKNDTNIEDLIYKLENKPYIIK
ncbi:6-carboxyhexanoate--CoA ligase [Methanococcus aeolicus Nankai-3]|uniref:6-carboxyhexanoate--CoA ligase n=1 Tax=Methanococcus aeolicus (strain ATCC BAA-1280 / DSM 17508 / OCM 812 / Nankai-3) TaxID=419665 RepID=BIOW_META3|nr:6-carboxyhexanoate--CoA ligase [Methanococcus aeolicus]A6UWX4.1 RecName: Full=6-carboxyhexanoate--CoA ligase; AltName: Full=Pimeloyl-CoA synthase [Methanococcus aeolicus Nankai-3]ABR56996.1 6-carboxyhexanoate--CoA ligase [Methanococcus aeolicus Nankai-3]